MIGAHPGFRDAFGNEDHDEQISHRAAEAIDEPNTCEDASALTFGGAVLNEGVERHHEGTCAETSLNDR